MSPLSRQSTLFLQSRLTEEFHSEFLWADDSATSVFHGGTSHFFGGALTTLDDPPALPTINLLSSFEDDRLGPSSVSPEDLERINDVTNGHNVPFGIRPEDLFSSAYQTTCAEPYREYNACLSAEAMWTHGIQPMLIQPDISMIAQTLSNTHLVPSLVYPSATVAYPQFLAPHVLPFPSSESNSSIPTSPSVSLRSCDSSGSDADTDYLPSSSDEHQPTTSPQLNNRKATYESAFLRRAAFSPTRSTSSESEKSTTSYRSGRRSHPYERYSRNFQCEDSASFTKGKFASRCPVVGCDYVQKNRRIPDLKRHIETHDRWREPEKWVCCGVGMDRAHLYDKLTKQDMSDDERIEAGAYEFRGQLMIGGCMRTFSRRDALKRHIDNRKNPCIGHMRSYRP